jgi:hypothetical protein
MSRSMPVVRTLVYPRAPEPAEPRDQQQKYAAQ